jgi:putative transposase
MPAKNLIKIDVENGYYHIYNRGVEKRIIFEDEQDYKVFLGYLKEHLSSPPETKDLLESFILRGTNFRGIPHIPKNYFQKVKLLAYCLMPNHFHLLIKQIEKGSMSKFMRSLATRYSMYFNKKYNRVGTLFQGIYKASMIENENYLLHLSRYIHLNPSEYFKDLTSAYSSYADYLEIRKTLWVDTNEVLSYFNKASSDFLISTNTYKDFVESYKTDNSSFLEGITLEEN